MAFIDPNTVHEFKYESTQNGMNVYQISEIPKTVKNGQFYVESTDGQLAVRWVLNNTAGLKINPWCWIQNCKTPYSNEYQNLDLDSLWWWSLYSYEDKKVAIKDKRLHSFRAISLYDEIAYKRNNGIDKIVDKQDFYDYCKPWSNRQNIQSAELK